MRYWLAIVFIAAQFEAFSQDPPAPDGEIEDAQVIIEKDREIVLPFAQKYFEKIDDRYRPSFSESLSYDFESFEFQPQPYLAKFSAADYEEPLEPFNSQSEIRLGYGNLSSPLFKASIHSRNNEKYAIGADLNHLSFGIGPVDDENSASSSSGIALKGIRTSPNSVFYAKLGFAAQSGYFYGYDPSLEVSRDSIKQAFNAFDLSLAYEGQSDQSSFQVSGDLVVLNDEYEESENKFEFKAGAVTELTELLSAALNLEGIFSTYNVNGEGQGRNLYRLNPKVIFEYEKIRLAGGVRLAIVGDDTYAGNSTNFFPDIKAELLASTGFNLFASLDGDIEARFYSSSVDENFFISNDVVIDHSLAKLRVGAGAKGSSAKFDYELGVLYKQVENMAFFVNGMSDSTRFDLIYDQGTTNITNTYFQLGYVHGERSRTFFRVDYYGYSTDSLAAPWHKPTLDIRLTSSNRLTDKLTIGIEASFLSGIEAFNSQTNEQKSLDAIFDLSLQADYKLSDHWGAFVSFRNLLGNNYQRYWNYPNRGIMAKLGVSYAF